MNAMPRWAAGLLALGLVGCGAKVAKVAAEDPKTKPVPVTATAVVRRPVARTVEIVGSLRGMEEVVVGAKKGGRVLRYFHDIGDKVGPGEPLVELDPVDAKLAVLQADSRYLGELVKLGVTRQQAESFLAKHGYSEKVLRGEEADKLIREVPAVVQAFVMAEKAQQNLTRQRRLISRNAGTDQELQNFENDAKAADAQRDNAVLTARNVIANALSSKVSLDVANQALGDMVVRAPEPSKVAKGRPVVYAVNRRDVAEGQYLRDGEAVFSLVIADPLRLRANVPERFSAEVEVGQSVTLRCAGRPEAFAGTLSRINPSVDPASRTFQVEATVPNPRNYLRPGGFAKAEITTRRDDQATVVPIESIVRYAGVTKIFLVEGSKARAVSVETGLEGKDWVEVSGEIPEGSRVVTTGQSRLAEGTPVSVRIEGKTPPPVVPAPAVGG